MAVPSSGTLTLLGIAQEALYGTYGSGTITSPIHLYDLVNGGNSAGSGNFYPAVNTACLPNPVDRSIPSITTVSATSITSSTVTTGGSNIIDGSSLSGITQKGIEYSVNSNFSSSTIINEGTGTSSFATTISNLNPNTSYYIRAYATSTVGTGYGSTVSFQTLAIPVTNLTWVVSSVSCSAAPWTITAGNQTIRYDIADSANCVAGGCSTTQTGTATATITVGSSAVNLGLAFTGMGEAQSANFEKITFTLDGTQVADAHAPGGGLGCVMGPVVKTFTVASPYTLAANSTHTLAINFTTADALYHVNAYYEVNLSFT